MSSKRPPNRNAKINLHKVEKSTEQTAKDCKLKPGMTDSTTNSCAHPISGPDFGTKLAKMFGTVSEEVLLG